jgi:hypothetical protein
MKWTSFIFVFLFLLLDFSDVCAQKSSAYVIFFSIESAQRDTLLPPEISADLDIDGTKLLRSVAIDLNGDKRKEKFVYNEQMCGTGGCLWTICDMKKKTMMGIIEGAIVYIRREKENGFPKIETYWKIGTSSARISYYAFSNGRYRIVRSEQLRGPEEVQKYFSKRPLPVQEMKILK